MSVAGELRICRERDITLRGVRFAGYAVSGGAKLKRAKKHVDEFETVSKAFLQTHPYVAVSQFDPERGTLSFVVRERHALPECLGTIAGDAVHNLRAVLDVLWHQAWTRGAGGMRKQNFPMIRDANELKTRFGSVKKPHHKAAVDILRATLPYKGWKELVFDLNEIDARDKHEVPILAAVSYQKLVMKLPPDVALQGRTGLQIVTELADGHIFLKDGTELPMVVNIQTDSGPLENMEGDLTADIAFGEGEILEGTPVLKTLHECTQVVDGLANAFLAARLLE